MGIFSKLFDKVTPEPIKPDWAGVEARSWHFDEMMDEKLNKVGNVRKQESIMIDNKDGELTGGEQVETKPNNKLEVYEELLELIHQTYIAKNSDYGDAFGVSLDKRGLVAALVRMEDKMSRLDSLKDKPSGLVDESLMDTALDLANYALMTAVWLKQRSEKEIYKVYADDKVVAEFPKELGEHSFKIDTGTLSPGDISVKNAKIDPIMVQVNPYPTPVEGTNINIQGSLEGVADEDIKNLVRESLKSHEKGIDCNG